MVFSSLIFLYVFLPINLIFYFISKNNVYRNIVLLSFSLFFYAWGEPFLVSVMLFCGAANYFFALLIDKYRGTYKCKLVMILTLCVDLGLLGFFKYFNFFIGNVNFLLHTDLSFSKFGLPIGISFYTFQIISYVIDVYRKDVPAQKHFYKLLLYMSLYHQLIAGPIVRYKDVAYEIDNRVLTPSNMSYGVNRFIIGLLKKVLLANTAGKIASVFLDGNFSQLSVFGAWFGIILFTVQIYYDFSGYSDMAIGLGRIFGFTYKENFDYPYISKTVSEFWRRWHISLGSFFRDYVYIPLGGNRRHLIRNLFVVWMLTGFWHGASWNFVLWGLYYGIFIMLERTILSSFIKKIPNVLSHVYLMLIVTVGWVFFYYIDLNSAFKFISIMFGLSGNPVYDLKFEVEFMNNIIFFIIALAACTPVFAKISSKMGDLLLKFNPNIPTYLFHTAFNTIILILSTIMLVGQTYNPFLYFRF